MGKILLPSVEDDATKPAPSIAKSRGRPTKKRPKTSHARRSQALESPIAATEKPKVKEITPPENSTFLCRYPSSPLIVCAHPLEPPTSSPWTRNGLFSSLHALDAIAVQTVTRSASSVDVTAVVAATIRCIDVLHDFLTRSISPASVSPENATPQETLDGIERILPNILRTVIPALNGAFIDSSNATRLQWLANPADDDLIHTYETVSALDIVLARVATRIIVPAIRALVPCTLAKTEYILSAFKPESPKRDFADGTQLLSLISTVLDAFSDSQYITLHDLVALEAVRELTSLIVDRPPSLPHAQLTSGQRVHRIARKDALYFLCDAALLAFHRSTSASSGTPEEMLRTALAEALGDLALTQSNREGSGSGLDIVEESLVMVVLERAWSVGVRVGHVGGNVDDKEMNASHHDVHERDGDVTMMDVDAADKPKVNHGLSLSPRRKSSKVQARKKFLLSQSECVSQITHHTGPIDMR